ncbi:hypothetical protein EJB05_39238, partial [Eragrostis curvula]
MPLCRRGRNRRHRRRSQYRRRKPRRDWAGGLPTDVLLAIFHRLDHADVLMSVDSVCREWRRAARDEPSLWRRITVRWHFVDDFFLRCLNSQAPFLKSLRLIYCDLVSLGGLAAAVTAHPLLEELELSLCGNIRRNWASFQQCSHRVTNEGLEAILDSCPKLEYLDIRHCFNIEVDTTLLSKCSGIKTLRLPDDPTDDYELEIQTPVLTYELEDDSSVWSSDGRPYTEYGYSEDSDDSSFYDDP